MSFRIKSVAIVFYVADLVRTEAFYRDALGIALTREEGAEPFWLQGQPENGPSLIFFQQPGRRGDTPSIVFELDEGGIDDVVADLASLGVTIVTPVSEAPGGWSADFLDPDGFSLGLYQYGELPRSLKPA